MTSPVMARHGSTDLNETSRTMAAECHAELNQPELKRPAPTPSRDSSAAIKKRRRPIGPPPGFAPLGDNAPSPQGETDAYGHQLSMTENVRAELWPVIAESYNIDWSWKDWLLPELCCPNGSKLLAEYERRAAVEDVFPPRADIFAWTKYCAPPDVKVVIVGQDPYVHPGQAHGLAFSVKRGITIPPSLQNIFSAVKACYPSIELGAHGCLEDWAKRGVLLLNSVLTVKKGEPGSHHSLGWQTLVRNVLRRLSLSTRGIVFMLWGARAQTIYFQTDRDDRHLVLKYSHPSPLSRRPFASCTHFKDANEFLCKSGKGGIDWSIGA
ncbi:UL2 protein [Gallid alphaherpesvirus 3]|uniref:UL2 protein n=2 Tax=Gallid alphaherpesvirus 3 TaxID=35250 RepID=Q782U5_9ALPH|nr:uracil-DNA glycosylase [Gallid alphaherpesvirus 3]YP_010795594.1 uracil-DNA glycosylase [Gallid alphaherpesvirus 3]BAA82895.1 UL2 product homolog [Marek's disease virus serotype 2 MDV2]AEI00203.1 uracil-DNA glycosylase [Gallid alphaherpesvirus 3]QEY02258.1 uracil-DNA glycosylase [Gallid alphaherpesvirus 3]BAB16509.1 UL2 protein [Gallid alphaherpesvirus 3]